MYEPEIRQWMNVSKIRSLICPLGILMFGTCMIFCKVCGACANGDWCFKKMKLGVHCLWVGSERPWESHRCRLRTYHALLPKA